MTALKFNWSNKLEKLADNMFDSLYGEKATWKDPMMPRCIVTNSPVMQAWLRHYFIFDWSERNKKRVLANCDFQLLYPFINDWMDKLLIDHTGDNKTDRTPRNHPYSTTNLQWRIYKLMINEKLNNATFKTINAYLGDDPMPRRQFQLAGKLAIIFDEYQVYRSDIVNNWKKDSDDWQEKLWELLLEDNPNSYAALFHKMNNVKNEQLKAAFDNKYEQVAVFGTTAMSRPYISFLNQVLAKVVNVDMYILNPGKEYWLEDTTAKKQKKIQEKLKTEDLEIAEDPLAVPEKGHELLCSLGESLQEYLYIINEQCLEGEAELFDPPTNKTLLGNLQNKILNNDTEEKQKSENNNENIKPKKNDDSIQIHICHSARREVEVLHDHILDWLTNEKINDTKLQPYQIEVLVSDMETYAPHIDAIFSTSAKHSTKAVPYVIDTRSSSADSEILNSFYSICNIVTSRFQVTPIIDLLSNESILKSFNLNTSDLNSIEQIVSVANIRWGLNADHRKDIADVTMPAYMTWEYGLDRLLAGYVTGEFDWHNDLLTVDHIEGSSAEILGKLARFIHELKYYNQETNKSRSLPDWQKFLAKLLDTFFSSTENTYREISRIRNAINDLEAIETNSGMNKKEIPFEVIVAHLTQALAGTTSSDSLTANSVIFCQLRPMNSRPAEITCVLGLNDGTFPRNDNRPTFDLLKQTRRKGDRSMRRDDRCAFLEAIVNARSKLYLSYTGRSDKDNQPIPPSIVLQELKDYLNSTYNLDTTVLIDGTTGLALETLHHLNAIDPDYFNGTNKKLFSYSYQNFLAAQQLSNSKNLPESEKCSSGNLSEFPAEIDINILKEFFVNPAKHFYSKKLDVRLEIYQSILPDDDEPMETNTLDAYKLKMIILNKLQDNNFNPLDNTDLTKTEKVEGHIPLGEAGDDAITKITDDITTWLNDIILIDDYEYPCLKEVFKTQLAKEEQSGTVEVDSVKINGSYRLFQIYGRKSDQCADSNLPNTKTITLQMEARPAGLKTKDKIRAWISHLFACATTKNEDSQPYTVIIGMDAGELDSKVFEPLSQKDAEQGLATLIDLYKQGQLQPLPFAPETSEFYYELLDSDNMDQISTLALYRAADKWGTRKQNGTGDHSECQDDSLFHAFGVDGPHNIAPDLFHNTAKVFFKPMHDAILEENK